MKLTLILTFLGLHMCTHFLYDKYMDNKLRRATMSFDDVILITSPFLLGYETHDYGRQTHF